MIKSLRNYREYAKEIFPVIKAFSEGKDIQCKHRKETDVYNDWIDALYPNWNYDLIYRVKPEPKYVPFTRKDWDLFKMKEVCNNPDDGVVVVIISCDNYGVRCGGVLCTYEAAFDSVVFADGTPFGKLVTI